MAIKLSGRIRTWITVRERGEVTIGDTSFEIRIDYFVTNIVFECGFVRAGFRFTTASAGLCHSSTALGREPPNMGGMLIGPGPTADNMVGRCAPHEIII